MKRLFSVLLIIVASVAMWADDVQYSDELLLKAQQGDAEAQKDLGVCYCYGSGVDLDYNQAVYWFRKAAEQDNAAALCNLGICYGSGMGVELDYNQAVSWYRRAIELGSAAAQCNLGVCYEYGHGVHRDYAQSVYWYRKAAERGNTRAQCNLGLCYDNGRGVEQDYAQAVYWYRKAADQDDASAQCNLGMCYEYGSGVDQDYSQAVYWYRKAVEQGDARAQCNLGWCYDNGYGVDESTEQALYWYRKSAEQGYAVAQRNIGWCYENGQGVEVDPTQAAWWYRKSAEQGFAYAQTRLAALYEDGKGVPCDSLMAYYWYAKAAEQAEEEAYSWWWTSTYQPNLPKHFSTFCRQFVESRINEWQKKGEFEKTSDYLVRVDKQNRQRKVDSLVVEARDVFIVCAHKEAFDFLLGSYDADNEIYKVQTTRYGDIFVPVDIADARYFKSEFNNCYRASSYDIANDTLTLSRVEFYLGDKVYVYDNSVNLTFAQTDIDYNFEPIDIQLPSGGSAAGKQTIAKHTLRVGASDVDTYIPASAGESANTFVVIIANEQYRNVAAVPFAQNDGRIFHNYCTKTLGIPERCIRFVRDATINDIKIAIHWLEGLANAFDNPSIIFYYAGHGIPDEATKASYLLPTDGLGADVTTAYKLDDLYRQLESLKAARVTVFMDACFSGSKREDGMLASARGVAIKARAGVPTGNMVVFSAAQGDETAYPYNEEGHGMFTYFLLKKLQETSGNVTLGELGDYITTRVRQESMLSNHKSQTPSVQASAALGDTWKSWTLK